MKPSLLFIMIFALWAGSLQGQVPNDSLNRTDSLGRKQGYWKKYVNDTLKYEGNFSNDIPTGEFKYYYPGEKLKSVVQYSEKGRNAVTVNYHANGKMLAEGIFADKKKNGAWKYYDESGILSAVESYVNGIPEGEWISYYKDGKPNDIITYKEGMKNGPCSRFYPDSILCFKGNYKNDKQSGTFYYYNPDKQLHLAANYQDEIPSGLWFYYGAGGLPEKRLTYVNGRVKEEEIAVREDYKTNTYISISKIAYIFYHNGKSTIRLHDGTNYISQRKMDEFESVLNPDHFYRISTAYYVTRVAITNLKSYSQTERQLKLRPQTPSTVFVSERLASGFIAWAGLIKEGTEIKNTTNDY